MYNLKYIITTQSLKISWENLCPKNYPEQQNVLGICPRKYPLGHAPRDKIHSNGKNHSNTQIADGKFSARKLAHHNRCTTKNHQTITVNHHSRKRKFGKAEY